MSRRLLVRDRRKGLLLGYGAVVLGSYLLYEAYEKRGRRRPFAARFAPGP